MSDTSMSAEQGPLVGQLLAERYHVTARVGQGGMGMVYEAVDTRTGQAVAVKTLLPETEAAHELAARFQREAQATSLLNHPHIVEVVLMGGLPDGTLFLIMELVRGTGLDELIVRRALGPRRALIITRQTLLALHHAHQHGMIHRDLKPENIMLVPMGRPEDPYDHVKLLDFGLVKLVGDAAVGIGMDRLTATGMIYGTPAYMAPEQALGRVLDGRADLYALGVMIFEMLTGRVPFDSPDPMEMLRMHVGAPAPRLAEVAPGAPWCTPALEALVGRALAKQPAQRFADARDMMVAVDEAFLSISHLPAER